MQIKSVDVVDVEANIRGGGGSYFLYILLNEIETMFSQLAKQSHWKLSADSSIAHEHILPVNLPVKACTKTRNNETKPPKQAKRQKRNHRNDRNDRNDYLFQSFRFARFARFGRFVSVVSVVSFRSLRSFCFGGFVSLFRVLVHAPCQHVFQRKLKKWRSKAKV